MLKIKKVGAVADITGRHITSKWGVVGTDGGKNVYSPSQKRMYFLFGDTFDVDEKDPMKETNWRGTVAGYTSDFDTSKGIRFDGFLCDKNGKAKELVRKHACKNNEYYEVTKICQGGIEIDGTLYFGYESIRHWGTAGRWDANVYGVLKSTDGGETLTKVRDLTWVEPLDKQYWPVVKEIAEENEDFTPSGYNFDVESHLAPGFACIVFVDGKDGYIYGYGRYSGRFHGLKISRVKKKNFEIFDEWEYLIGYDEDQKPIWLKGKAGREYIIENAEAVEVVPPPMSNLSIIYNNYVGKWLLLYHYPEKGIYGRESDTPYGPFSDEAQEILTENHPDLLDGISAETDGNRLYACYTHEMICREQGRVIPLILSQWYQWPGHPKYYGSRIFDIELE